MSVRRSQKEMSRARSWRHESPTPEMDKSVNSSPSRRSSVRVEEWSAERMERERSVHEWRKYLRSENGTLTALLIAKYSAFLCAK